MASDWIDKQFESLKQLAEARFAPLSEAERKMLRAAIEGDFAWCGPSKDDDNPHNNPSSGEVWGSERKIRAELLRWLCADKAAEGHVDPRGIRVHGAKISGELDLSFVTVRFPLVLRCCCFTADLLLTSAGLTTLELSGSSVKAVRAKGAKVGGNVSLNDGFSASGVVSFSGARIDGTLECDGGIFRNPAEKDVNESGLALTAQYATVNGSVSLRHGFRAEGAVWLLGAQIAGDVDCQGGSFSNPHQEGVKFSGRALEIADATVKGNILLRFGFVAEGKVELLGVRIAGDLDCENAQFDEVVGQRIAVQRALVWRNIKSLQNAALDLQAASAGSLVDDTASWPKRGRLLLDGFVYGRIGEGAQDSKSRLEWLDRQESFTPQPYRQLAKILREDGDDPGARHVLYAMEKKKHQDARHGWLARLWTFFFRATIGYGIYPRWALRWLLLLVVLGWMSYDYGYGAGAIAPTNKDAYGDFHRNHRLPEHYAQFYALVYSAENSFPVVKLGQTESWTPEPNMQGYATFLRVFRWSQILLGWILATFFVAGVTGIARKD